MKKMTNAQIIKALKSRAKALERERDILRDLMDDIGALESAASDALESLECAIDRLSELVR